MYTEERIVRYILMLDSSRHLHNSLFYYLNKFNEYNDMILTHRPKYYTDSERG